MEITFILLADWLVGAVGSAMRTDAPHSGCAPLQVAALLQSPYPAVNSNGKDDGVNYDVKTAAAVIATAASVGGAPAVEAAQPPAPEAAAAGGAAGGVSPSRQLRPSPFAAVTAVGFDSRIASNVGTQVRHPPLPHLPSSAATARLPKVIPGCAVECRIILNTTPGPEPLAWFSVYALPGVA